MLIGVLIFALAVLVVLVGAKESEAIVLYYDAEDVLPSGDLKSPKAAESSDPEGDVSAAIEPEVESAAPRVKVTVAGAEVNKAPRKRAATPPPTETKDDLRAAAKAHDPAQARAQDIFDDILGGKL